MRVYIASMGTETNTFASFPTAIGDFKSAQWIEDGVDGKVEWPWTAPQQLWLKRCRELGWDTLEGLHTYAEPGGLVVREAYEQIRDTILASLGAAGDIDLMLVYLHGAMVADGYDDCEGDLVTRIRAMLKPGARTGVLLDHHAHMTAELLATSDAIVLWKAYPHIDYRERADDLFGIMRRTLAGEIEPVMAVFECRALGLFPTTREGPMPAFVDDMTAAEGKGGILSLSLIHGFGWADTPITGSSMLAVADPDMAAATSAADTFGKRFYAERRKAALPFVGTDWAVARAAEYNGSKPILLADTSDQVGGGAPGDTRICCGH
ncbi:MAG: microcystin degradation protein MlrC-like protein [Devosia sp.]|nr:microcystin degradation protein MlrC-like protein [Devosia sp.]